MSNKRFSTIKDLPGHYNGAFSVPGLRHLVFNRSTNGFDKCIRRVGRKILIDLDAFEAWIDDSHARASLYG